MASSTATNNVATDPYGPLCYGPREDDLQSGLTLNERYPLQMEPFDIEENTTTVTRRFLEGHRKLSFLERVPQAVLDWTRGPRPPRQQAIKSLRPSL